jgi:quercetin dioxygenase-like cupin family protein
MTQPAIYRKELLSLALSKTITSIEVREIAFEPGQESGRHKHPCPVVGYIVQGSAVLQIEGQSQQLLPAGSAFYEPAEVVIERFDNASSTEPMKFVACYLLEGKQQLIEMLPARGTGVC